jgi:hypothetical protein
MPYIENTIGAQADGWHYAGEPSGGDARKLVTLVEGGMTWVGIRAFNFQGRHWMNNNEPERAEVKAWRDLDQPASGFWDRGRLFIKPVAQSFPADVIGFSLASDEATKAEIAEDGRRAGMNIKPPMVFD